MQPLRPYLVTCGLLLLPIFAWNAAFLSYLPPEIANPSAWGAIPKPLAVAENLLRVLIFGLPFFIRLGTSTKSQKFGLSLYIVGTLVYFASWVPLLTVPQSPWSTSAAGFLAPAYTPAIWLFGIALQAHEFSWGAVCPRWVYGSLAACFLLAHISHATIVYLHTHSVAGA